eukprot:359833-Chlamydomonas_euryale.AAC.6
MLLLHHICVACAGADAVSAAAGATAGARASATAGACAVSTFTMQSRRRTLQRATCRLAEHPVSACCIHGVLLRGTPCRRQARVHGRSVARPPTCMAYALRCFKPKAVVGAGSARRAAQRRHGTHDRLSSRLLPYIHTRRFGVHSSALALRNTTDLGPCCGVARPGRRATCCIVTPRSRDTDGGRGHIC